MSHGKKPVVFDEADSKLKAYNAMKHGADKYEEVSSSPGGSSYLVGVIKINQSGTSDPTLDSDSILEFGIDVFDRYDVGGYYFLTNVPWPASGKVIFSGFNSSFVGNMAFNLVDGSEKFMHAMDIYEDAGLVAIELYIKTPQGVNVDLSEVGAQFIFPMLLISNT